MSLQESLYELYVVDQRVRGLEGRLEGAQRHARTQQAKLDRLDQQLSELRDQLRHDRAAEATLESEAEGMEERIGRLRDQMNTARNNKEYSARLVEVNTLKTEKGKLEERALELMSRIEEFGARVEAVEAERAEQEKVVALAEGKLADRQAEVGDQLDDARSQREEAAKAVPADELAVFDRLAESLDGEAMAPVEQEDPRRTEFTCGGCYMGIPVDVVNRLFAQDKLIRCTSCSRILYPGKQVREAMGGKK